MASPRRQLAALVSLTFAATLLTQPPAQAVPTWQPVSDLSAAGQSGYVPLVAVDAVGNATAIWQQDTAAGDVIQTASRLAGGTWSAPLDLSSAGQDARSPDLAVDDAGNATAVWERSNGTHTIIQTATRPAGGTWSGASDLSGGGENAQLPQVALGPNGSATAVWYRSDASGHNVIQAASRSTGGTWSTPDTISVTGRDAHGPQVVMDASGNATAVWRRQNDIGHLIIQGSTRPTGGAWSVPTNISAALGSANTPRIAIDPAGHVTAVWFRWNGSHYIVQAASRPVGGTWSASSDLTGPGLSAQDPQVAVDGAGNATAIWYRSNGSHTIIQAATRPSGGTWSAATDLSAPGQHARDPRIAVDPRGNATAVWRRSDGTHSIVQTAARPAGGTWSAATDQSAPGQGSFAPEIAVDDTGNGVTTWSRDDGAQSIVQARGLDVAGPVITGLTTPTTAATSSAQSLSVASYDVWSSVSSTAWAFGDGTTATGNAVTHAWTTPGTYTVTVTLADAVGNATTTTRSIAVTQPVPPLPAPPVAPEITGLRLKPKQIEIKGSKRKTRTKVFLRLTEDAKATITLKRKGAKSKQRVVLRKSVDAGRTTLRLTSKQLKRKLGKKHFKPGRYKLTVKATNRAGKDKRSITLRVRR